ncbi:hypothetical protein AQUCO_00100201v1 [Aquilegia coerulea]|uniref:Uncharacterized protein n=1 Tax=Aquilegia coerulea TaxID=218851 RepID=A0A2G5F975_AQUCA|nr:hypothetical protein AQUCO_00100201v1 [Aquilegia coerulea]
MAHIQVYNMFFLICFLWFMISSRCQLDGTMVDSKVLNVGVGLWEETIPLKLGSRLYELRGLKSSSWRLLNTEKLIFKAGGNNSGGMYVRVSVEPAGVFAIPYAAERESVIFNIICEELLFGIPHKAWWVGGVVLLCLVLAFLVPYYLPFHLLQKNQSICSANSAFSKDS